MDREILIKTLVDSRNENVWKAIDENCIVSFASSKNNEYSCFTQSKNVTFYIVENNLCSDSFTHEMLHVHLRLNNCFIGSGLQNTINGSRILTSILTPALIEHIGNCLDHIKMLPLYLEMGFKRELFILDYQIHKCQEQELRSIKNNYRSGKKVNASAVDLYLGKLFAIKADPNIGNDYSSQLVQLKKIDLELFLISESMINKWINAEAGNYHPVLADYYTGLKKWMTNKEFI